MRSPAPAWKRELHRRMEAEPSSVREQSSRSGGASETAIWASPSTARVRSRPSNLHAALRVSSSFAVVQRDAAVTPLQTPVRVLPRTTQATHKDAELTDVRGLRADSGIRLGAFGEVQAMTVETVNFLIRVLEDRKQELLVSGEDAPVRVRAGYAVSEEDDDGVEEVGRPRNRGLTGRIAPASNVARFQLASTGSDGAGMTELVRSHSYEALVQLEGILEARHNKLMSNGLLETADGNS